MRDDRLYFVHDIRLFYNEVRACKEGCHCTAKEQRPHNTIDNQTGLEGFHAEKIACLVLKFIAYSLNDEREKYDDPHPISRAEAGAVKEWERCEECTAERNERGEGKFPLATRRVYHHTAFYIGLTQLEYHRVGTLHKH